MTYHISYSVLDRAVCRNPRGMAPGCQVWCRAAVFTITVPARHDERSQVTINFYSILRQSSRLDHHLDLAERLKTRDNTIARDQNTIVDARLARRNQVPGAQGKPARIQMIGEPRETGFN